MLNKIVKKVYISGQITGLSLEEAKKNFSEMEEKVIKDGHYPINPMKIMPYHPELTWQDYMRKDIAELAYCHAIYVHPNHVNSKGAKIELLIAECLGLEIIHHKCQ